MKGKFVVLDGEPYVFVKKKKFKLTNVIQCSLHHQTSHVMDHRQIWNVVPFTDLDFWAEGKPIPVINEGQEIEVEKIEKRKAKIKSITT